MKDRRKSGESGEGKLKAEEEGGGKGGGRELRFSLN